VAVLVALVVAVAACGIPLQSEPEALDIEISPVSLPPAAEELGPTPSTIFLVRDGSLIPVSREPVSGAAATIRLLLEGPTLPEEREGLRSAIPANTELLAVEEVDGVTVVDLSAAFANIGGTDEILAVGQIVVTLGAAGVGPLRIHLDGNPGGIPLPDGALTTRPVTLDDYEVLLAE
jgi:hypothetical protein